MKTTRFTNSWLITLGIGSFLFAIYILLASHSGLAFLFWGFIFFILSLICSTPFILFICFFNQKWSKEKISKRNFYKRIFLLHTGISFLTCLLGQTIWETKQIVWEVILVVFGYFLIHSIFIHINITRFYGEEFEKDFRQPDPDLLDDLSI